jgi:hypothetical protein
MSFISLDDEDPLASQSTDIPSSEADFILPSNNRLVRISGVSVYKWTTIVHKAFLDWWHLQSWYSKHTENQELDKQIGWNSINRTSPTWKSFDQGAKITTGEPVVVCQRCRTILVHPGVKRSGTNTMKTHLSSNTCNKRSYKSSLPQRQQGLLFSPSPVSSLLY